ncbi:hypothetical protein TNIN_469151 [Trichonephila inaurata madagascariensis]|uniref:Uncharacterized protein n=1 Tax=Trichonephila inaurata madagascariensis TaxID=2747483 RepID=A0A8X6YJ03_9ARAC|nr:hypothetical protein TNIN_469151 [Trichonephila inaurata madagascariensis]
MFSSSTRVSASVPDAFIHEIIFALFSSSARDLVPPSSFVRSRLSIGKRGLNNLRVTGATLSRPSPDDFINNVLFSVLLLLLQGSFYNPANCKREYQFTRRIEIIEAYAQM